MRLSGQLGYTADGSPTLQAKSADRDFNLRLLESLGYAATPGIAAGLELPEGMKTADQLFREQQLAGRGSSGGGGSSAPADVLSQMLSFPNEWEARNFLAGLNLSKDMRDYILDNYSMAVEGQYNQLTSKFMSGVHDDKTVQALLAAGELAGADMFELRKWIDSLISGPKFNMPSWDRVAGLPKWAYLPNK